MNELTQSRNQLRAQKVIKALEARNMPAYYAPTAEQAKQLALSLITEGSTVGWGGTMTCEQIGLLQALREGNYQAIDRATAHSPEEAQDLMRQIFFADYFVTSCNALSEDGVIVNIDGLSNRISAIAFGPKKVIMVVGMNKIVRSEEDAYRRAKYEVAPTNAQRFDLSTPCKKTGVCYECTCADTICCNVLTTRYSRGGRIQVILVGEELGL